MQSGWALKRLLTKTVIKKKSTSNLWMVVYIVDKSQVSSWYWFMFLLSNSILARIADITRHSVKKKSPLLFLQFFSAHHLLKLTGPQHAGHVPQGFLLRIYCRAEVMEWQTYLLNQIVILVKPAKLRFCQNLLKLNCSFYLF